MTLKPGDLAHFFRNSQPECMDVHIGAIVTVNEYGLVPGFFGPTMVLVPSWTFSPMLQCTCGRTIKRIPARDLRPIGNPGDDAVDEMVQLLGKASDLPIYTSVTPEVER